MGRLIWITGLSGAGKTTVAKQFYAEVKSKNLAVVYIDGDSIREINGNDLGHNLEDRIKNAYRIVKLCEYLCNQGLVVICATMSLYSEIHKYIYEHFSNPLIVYLDVSKDELKRRNQKGLYDSPKDLSGFDLPFDKPEHGEYVIVINNEHDLNLTLCKIRDKYE